VSDAFTPVAKTEVYHKKDVFEELIQEDGTYSSEKIRNYNLFELVAH
jgi:hypothetical protein